MFAILRIIQIQIHLLRTVQYNKVSRMCCKETDSAQAVYPVLKQEHH